MALKLSEGLSETLLNLVEREVGAALPPQVVESHFLPAMSRLRRLIDYAEIGGAPVLGVNGVAVIGHGRSRAKAVKRAIYQAQVAVEGNLIGAIKEGWQEMRAKVDSQT